MSKIFFLASPCLVASVAQGHPGQHAISHAMVLDTYDPIQDLFIFKNTYDDENGGQPKQFKIQRTDQNAPEELYFVHIEIRDMDNLPSQEQRKADKEAEIQKKKQQYEQSDVNSSDVSFCKNNNYQN